jgi:hypothetical protein
VSVLAVIIHSANGGRDWRADLKDIVDTLCGERAVTACATSVGDDGVDTDTVPFLAFVVATVDATAVSSLDDVAAHLAPLLDPARSSLLEMQERKVIAYERGWELGTQTPGERVVTVVERKPGMTRQEFDRYWREVHTGVALSYTVAPWAYVQYLTTTSLLPGGIEPDGALVMHFRSGEERRSRYEDHPDDAARGAADAAAFMDMERTRMTLMHETIWR